MFGTLFIWILCVLRLLSNPEMTYYVSNWSVKLYPLTDTDVTELISVY